jgi:histidyl-tRNA synthetase
MDLVLIVGERERVEDVVVLRDMHSRSESRVARSEIAAAVQRALA